MTDIVERARFTASAGIPDFTNSKLLDELADEIERQRGELHSVHAHLNYLRSLIDRLRAKLAEYENAPVRDGYEEAKQSNHE